MTNTTIATPWFTRPEAARYLGVSPGTLANWSWRRIGPRYYLGIDRRARYRIEDLEAFVASGQLKGGSA